MLTYFYIIWNIFLYILHVKMPLKLKNTITGSRKTAFYFSNRTANLKTINIYVVYDYLTRWFCKKAISNTD